jgi:hypothetical protein
LLVCPSFAANLESVIFWTSPKTGIDERIGDNALIDDRNPRCSDFLRRLRRRSDA